MKKRFLFQTGLLLFVLLAINSEALGESPWKWETSLQLNIQQGGPIHLPVGLYVDKELERYYVVDGGNDRILSFDRSGRFLSDFSASSSLSKPYALIREPGFLWIVEKGRNTLTGIDLKERKIIPEDLTYNGKKLYPDRIAKDMDTLFVLDKAGGEIFLVDLNFTVLARLGCEKCRGGLVDFKLKNGMIWALAQKDYKVLQFDEKGNFIKSFEFDKEKIKFPRSLAVDDVGYIYILDRHAGTVSVYDQTGLYKYEFLEPGNARGQLYYPVELQLDPWGRICIVDEGNGRVQIFSKR